MQIKYELLEILNRKCIEDINGLTIIEAPTGYGKTYQVIKYIQKNYKNHRVIFVANQEKLLPEDKDLTKDLTPRIGKDLLENTLRLKGLFNSFKDVFKNVDSYNIEFEYLKSKNMNIFNKMKTLMAIMLSNDNNEFLYGSEFYKTEYEFRETVKEIINENDFEKKFYTKLYPAIDVYNRNIILLTTKKFFLPVDPLIDKPFYFWDKPFNGKTIIIFDEIDATKSELLDMIISNNDQIQVDSFRFYRKIVETINNDNIYSNFPEDLKGIDYVKRKINIIKERCVDIDKNISFLGSELNYPFKLVNDFGKRRFIFYDKQRFTVIPNRNKCKGHKYFKHTFNDILKINEITIENQNKNIYDKKIDLEYIYEQVNSGIYKFISQISYLCLDYKKIFNNIHSHKITTREAVSSVIDKLNMGNEYHQFILTKAYNHIQKKHYHYLPDSTNDMLVDKRRFDQLFYRKGFSYLDIKDAEEHNFESKFYSINYDTTPESLLLSIAYQYPVIGVSATALHQSLITNYDLGFFKRVLGNNYDEYILSKDNLNTVSVKYIDSDYNLNVDDKDAENLKYLEKVIGNDRMMRHNQIVAKSDYYYLLKVCGDLYRTITLFLNSDDHSLLFFTTSNLRKNDDLYKLIKEQVEIISDNENQDNVIFEIISGNIINNDDGMKELKHRIQKSSKVIIVSALQTLGFGVNLQYDLLVEDIVKKKDFDSVFIPKPTNVIPKLSNCENDYKELAKYIFSMEYAMINDSINRRRKEELIKDAFSNVIGYQKKPILGYIDIDDIVVSTIKYIIQSLGRIKRLQDDTVRNINIYTTEEVKKYLKKGYKYYKDSKSKNEFYKLLLHANEKTRKHNLFDIDLLDKNNKTKDLINEFIDKWNWTENKIQMWKELRKFVLRYPTFDSLDKFKGFSHRIASLYYNFWDDIDKYSIGYRNIVKENLNDYSQNRYSISSASSGLDYIDENKEMREYFQECGYSTQWKPHKYIINKILFKNIYKGAIGEEVGRFIFSKFKIEIQGIQDNDIFEKFDFMINDNIMIDFKNWSEYFVKYEDEELENIRYKTGFTDIRVIYVINVFKESDRYSSVISEYKGIIIKTIPWLYDPNTKQYNTDALLQILKGEY